MSHSGAVKQIKIAKAFAYLPHRSLGEGISDELLDRLDQEAADDGFLDHWDTKSNGGNAKLRDEPHPSGKTNRHAGESTSDIDTRTVLVTFFPNKSAQSQRCSDLTLPRLAEQIRLETGPSKLELPWLKLMTFGNTRSAKGCLRTNANAQQITGIEVEHDQGVVTLDTAIAVLRTVRLRALVYTSPSYVPAAKEKWRILLPVSTKLSLDMRAVLVARVNGLFDGRLAPESFVLSQAYLYGSVNGNPAHRVEVIDGDFIDRRTDLNSGAMGKSPTDKSARATNGGQLNPERARAARADDAPRTDEELHQLLEATRIEHGWHENMLLVTASLIGRGYPDSKIKLICAPYFNNRFTDQDFADLLDGARKKWGKPNDEAEAATHIDAEVARLAMLSPLDYERQRKAAADKLDMRRTVLDELVGEVGSNSNNRLPKFAEVAEQLLRDIDLRDEELRVVVNENGFEHFWLYRDGLWSLLLEPESWLNQQIELTVRAMKLSKKANAKFIFEARNYIARSPNVRAQKHIVWDNHGMIPTLSGLVHPVTLAVRPLRKEDYATWRIDLEFNPSATCPLWQELLDDYFIGYNSDDTRNLLQEFSGTTLVDHLPKILRYALVAVGPSDAGKSTLLNILAGLLNTTAPPISTAIGDLSKAHGLQEFTHRRPWVLHEAFNVGEWHVSDLTKSIISGDPVSVNPKNIKALTMRVHTPAIWGSNHPPTFKENTDAIANRLLILLLKRVFDRHAPRVGVAAKAQAINPAWDPADLILAQERPGLLTWALTGLQRLLKRGKFILPLESEAAIEEMRRDANPVGAFVRDCIAYDPTRMMLTVDFHAAFTGWRKETHGDDKIHFTAAFIGKNLAALVDPRIVQDRKVFREEDGRRYYLGITLNQEGREHFTAQKQSIIFGSPGYLQFKRTSATAEETNRSTPGKWLDDPRVQKLVGLPQ